MEGWFSGIYDSEFYQYLSENKNPFEILDRPSFIGSLVDVLSPSQGTLDFGGVPLEELLRGIKGMYERGEPFYQRFQKPVKDKIRDLSVPKPKLKEFFRDYLSEFIKKSEVHASAHGGEPRWTPEVSLRTHMPLSSVVSFDISDAYKSIPESNVFGFYYGFLEGRNLSDSLRRNIAGFLTKISVIPYNGAGNGLAVGSSHSTPLFNRVLYPIDAELSRKSGERGMRYSRWIDDITISSPDGREFPEFAGAVSLVNSVLPVSPTKTFFQVSRASDGYTTPEQQFANSIYLLGERIYGSGISKNSRELKLKYKPEPVGIDTANFERW